MKLRNQKCKVYERKLVPQEPVKEINEVYRLLGIDFPVTISRDGWVQLEFASGTIDNTIFHEIGHIVLDHTEDSELADKEVNFFAKYALVPPVLVHKLKIGNPADIASVFDVSFEAACYAYSYYRKWLQYGSMEYTDYEIALLNLFQRVS